MSSLKYSNVVRKFVRCLPPPEGRHEKAEYCTALAQVVGCDRSLVVKEVKRLQDDVCRDYNMSPMEFYRQSSCKVQLLKDADIHVDDDDYFSVMALRTISTERYGRSVGNRFLSDPSNRLYPVVLDFLKLQAKYQKSTLLDVTLGYYQALGLLDGDVQEIAEELIRMDDDAGHMPYNGIFHIDASMDYLDSICKDRLYLRESLLAARKYILDHRVSFEAAGLNFVDSPGLTFLPDDDNNNDTDMSDMPDFA